MRQFALEFFDSVNIDWKVGDNLEGARQALMKDERQHFLDTEWPKIYATITRLGLGVDELMKKGARSAPLSQPFPTSKSTDNDDDSSN